MVMTCIGTSTSIRLLGKTVRHHIEGTCRACADQMRLGPRDPQVLKNGTLKGLHEKHIELQAL